MPQHPFDSPIQCVIFDCEGTLVDSEKLSHQALVETFSTFGVRVDLQDSLDHFEGGKLTDVLQQACERSGAHIPIDQLEPRFRHLCRQYFEAELAPVKGIETVLQALEQQGIDVCVASNSPVEKMAHALQLTKLLPYFEHRLFSAFDTNSWKPAPDLLHYAAMNMACPTAQCVFIDDTNKGIQAGINAEMRTIHFNPNPNVPTTAHPLVTRLFSSDALLHYFQSASMTLTR
ncbi:HAD-IA family hydrolase [Salinivibrio sharmensis]|uniref:Phosphatase n=1 Tax=Salinivibrio sharmensis TaxID=390883 RepID=A0ABX3KIU3_9GAMM|nr:HAD-IA family hydrolase [Salinivibrio sharmensis]OOE89242.1 phosphatase [Salinivibrio sharmensis]